MLLTRGGASIMLGGAHLAPRVPPRAKDGIIIAHGDSITASDAQAFYFGVASNLILSEEDLWYPYISRGLAGNSWNYDWLGASSAFGTLIEDAPGYVDPLQVPGIPNWLVLFAGTNGLSLAHNSAATEAGYFETYLQARLAAGWVADRIVVCTMLPREGGGSGGRAGYNALLVGLATTYGYRLARFDLDPNMGQDGQSADLTYYSDGTHPTDTGHAIMGRIVKDAMFP